MLRRYPKVDEALDAQARLQSDGNLPFLRRRVRSCRRWQLIVCDFGLTRLVTISACTQGFVTGVESKTPPELGLVALH